MTERQMKDRRMKEEQVAAGNKRIGRSLEDKKYRTVCETYIVKCADGTLYTGWTNHLERRLAAHNAGTGAKYTKSRRPVELVYHEGYLTKHEAMSREAQIKRMTRKEKLELIRCAEEGSRLEFSGYTLKD